MKTPGLWFAATQPKLDFGNGREWWCRSMRTQNKIMWTSGTRSVFPTRPCGSGENAGVRATSPSKTNRGRAGQRSFPPGDVAEVKVATCETVRETKLPLSKRSTVDLARRLPGRLGKPISRSTVFRILDSAAIKPWQHRSWIFPRAADFAPKAAVILDLYAGVWDGEPPGPNDYVLSADEKTSLQARIRTRGVFLVDPVSFSASTTRTVPERNNQHLVALSSFAAGSVRAAAACRKRIRSRRSSAVFGALADGLDTGGVGCASCQSVRTLRTENRHRTVRAAGGRHGAAGTVRFGKPSVPDRR